MWLGFIIWRYSWKKKAQKRWLSSLNKNRLARTQHREACLAATYKIIIQASTKIIIRIREYLLYLMTPARYSVNTEYLTTIIKAHQLVLIINYQINNKFLILLFFNLQRWSILPFEQNLLQKASHNSQWLFL